MSSVTAIAILIVIGQQTASAQGGPSACPDPGQRTCNPVIWRHDRPCNVSHLIE
ncbi:MAG: hypothetical protein JO327_12365 [Nitrososphaeraceae archaeon]|nr:hypothetical protein [Nitrososphaeraceae archaeon]